MIPAKFKDEREGALWTGRALDAGEECRIAWRTLRDVIVSRSK